VRNFQTHAICYVLSTEVSFLNAKRILCSLVMLRLIHCCQHKHIFLRIEDDSIKLLSVKHSTRCKREKVEEKSSLTHFDFFDYSSDVRSIYAKGVCH
jgi:hypothetical protein